MTGARRSVVIALALALTTTSGCASRPPPRAPIPRGAADRGELAANDELSVWAEGEQALSARYRVAPDGTIAPPGCPRLRIEGRTADAVADDVRACLVSRGVRAPEVRVTVLSRQRAVTVLGQVMHPGHVPLGSARTIVEAVTRSGGTTATGWLEQTQLRRVIDGAPRVFVVNVRRILEGDDEDVPLEAGDVVLVPERIF